MKIFAIGLSAVLGVAAISFGAQSASVVPQGLRAPSLFTQAQAKKKKADPSTCFARCMAKDRHGLGRGCTRKCK